MSGGRALGALRWLSYGANGLRSLEPSTQCVPKQLSRSMATETDLPTDSALGAYANAHVASPVKPDEIPIPMWNPAPAVVTLYDFPTMTPIKFLEYDYRHLLVPLRRDILHRAVVYEGDMTRQGTASTKWRDDVRGSGRKIRPQKGSGRARLGDKKSPMLRGGGVAFGPHPRDFSTGLPRKIYDLAWRTALSYRYRRGQLIVVNDNISMPRDASTHYLKSVFDANRWGKEYGKSSLITEVRKERLFRSASDIGKDVKAIDRADVDVKDLLETARLIIEKKALDRILEDHSSDLNRSPARA